MFDFLISIEGLITLIATGALLNSITTFVLILNLKKANGKISKLESLALDTYKGHHEHILLANRDKNCCEDVSSKTDHKLIREKHVLKGCGAFTTKARKDAGLVTRTEAKG